LHDLFGFDNTPFEKSLQQKEFHVLQDPRSNYNATVYSIASMLDMGYMKNMTVKMSYPDIFICRDIINNNNALSFFKQSGYKIYNYTFFDLDDKEEAVTNPFFREKKHLFTVQTFTERAQKDIGYNFASEKEKDNLIRRHFYNNRMQDSLTRKIVSEKTSSPKFVYTHFAMPHHPYYTDSNGKEFPLDRLTPDFSLNKEAYIEYLIYTNKKLLDLIDYIKNNSVKPPIIILMSDHGFRQFSQNTDKKYYFMNLNAVYFPDKNYGLFYNGMSNVNQFRVILNSQFRQKLPLLKDSAIFLPE
jgi:hypothetical protein